MDFLQNTVNTVRGGVSSGDPTVIGVLVAIVVVLVTVLVLVCRGSSNKRRGVLLVGLCDSGKTLTYNRLVNQKFVASQTSIKENSGFYYLKGEKSGVLRIIDLPGHERVRRQFTDQYKTLARAIIFVVDSLSFQREVKDIAGFLYALMSDKVIQQNAPPILIACNKQDQALAKGTKLMQSQLEKEMNTVRITQAAALSGTDNTGNNNIFLGKKNRDFQFSDLKPLSVQFVECSARGAKEDGEADLKAVTDWLMKIA